MDDRFLKAVFSKLDFSRSLLKEPLKAGQYDAIKGILITLIVMGHLQSPNPDYKEFQRILYNFHAPLFLLIAFIFPASQFSWESIKKRLKRYFVPIIWFSILSLLLFYFMFSEKKIGTHLLDYGWAMASGSAHYFNISTGFEAFWFIHALFGIFLLRSFSGRGTLPSLITFVIVLMSFYLINIDLVLTTKIPTLFTISAYCLALAPFVYWGINFLLGLNKKLAYFFAMGGFVFFSFYIRYTEHTYNIAHLRLPTLYQVLDLIPYILLLATGLATIILLAKTEVMKRLFSPIGEVSYEIYLTHIFILFAGKIIFDRLGWGTEDIFMLIVLFLSAGFTSFFISRVSRKIPAIGRYIFVR